MRRRFRAIAYEGTFIKRIKDKVFTVNVFLLENGHQKHLDASDERTIKYFKDIGYKCKKETIENVTNEKY